MRRLLTRHRQKTTVFAALSMFNFVLVLIQIWLFVAALEQVIAGQSGVILPAAIFSAIIFAANWWILRGLLAVDRQR